MRKTIGQNPLDQLQQLLVFDRYPAWQDRLGELGTPEEGTEIMLDKFLALVQEYLNLTVFMEDAVVDGEIDPGIDLRKGEDSFKIALNGGRFILNYPAIIKQLIGLKNENSRVIGDYKSSWGLGSIHYGDVFLDPKNKKGNVTIEWDIQIEALKITLIPDVSDQEVDITGWLSVLTGLLLIGDEIDIKDAKFVLCLEPRFSKGRILWETGFFGGVAFKDHGRMQSLYASTPKLKEKMNNEVSMPGDALSFIFEQAGVDKILRNMVKEVYETVLPYREIAGNILMALPWRSAKVVPDESVRGAWETEILPLINREGGVYKSDEVKWLLRFLPLFWIRPLQKFYSCPFD